MRWLTIQMKCAGQPYVSMSLVKPHWCNMLTCNTSRRGWPAIWPTAHLNQQPQRCFRASARPILQLGITECTAICFWIVPWKTQHNGFTYLCFLYMIAEEIGRGMEQSTGERGRKEERKVSDNSTVRSVYQICYNPVTHPEYWALLWRLI